ncbi:MAG: xanthine dehydrogenase family protein molybdopterin-binding subunit [Myxococcota bacterium]|nr:xanthine dehydrogenase family protein molybdopterin-binding subunit [Myxococcota bacterium]
MTAVGKGIDRLDARAKVTGKAQYAAEVPVANLVHAVLVTSTHAAAKVAVDVKDAEHAPGVLAVLTSENAPKLPGAKTKTGPVDRVLQLLQEDEAPYNDCPISVVVADTLERARAAAERISARYSSGNVQTELRERLGEAYAPKKAGPREPADSSRGDVPAGLESAFVQIDATYTTTNQTHNPMEMHGLTAVWQGEQTLTVYDTSQGIFGVRKKLATVFGLAESNVRVISRYVGGGFGCKGSPWSHLALCALAARVTGRPVRLVLTRPQMFSLVGYRPRTIQRVVLGADARGKLTAIRHDVTSETSRLDEFSEPSALQTRMLYACPNVATSHRLVRLDVPTPTFTRAPGEATGTFALEVALDELATALKLDPLELRLRNYAERDPHEDKPWSSKELRRCYQQAAERFGWAARRPDPGSQRDGKLLVGWGMATATYPARQSAASASARIDREGRVLVQAGTQDIGTGTYTIMAQIAADALGVPVERVRFELGDTSLPETPVSGGSQTASSTGSAVQAAALALKKKLLALGAPLSGPELDLKRLDAWLAQRSEPEHRAEARTEEKAERKRYSSHSFGAHFVELKIDADLRQIRVTRCVSAFAAGKILNPKTAHSQYIGGMVWGIGLALLEHTARDPRNGRVVTRDLADYHVPVHADIPELEVIQVDERDPYVNEIGAKGIGEIGITGMAAAIANAVHHATGKRVRDLPITLDKLL